MESGRDQVPLDKLLKETFTSNVRKGYIDVNGFTMPQSFLKCKEEIENFEVFDDDVWICSFSRSGTSWTQEMVWMIANDCDFEGSKERVDSRIIFLELSQHIDLTDFLERKDVSIPPFMVDSVKYCAQLKRPRFIKTHLPWELLPKQLREFQKRPKMVHVYRNPKEVCVSCFHHYRFISGFSGSFEDLYRLFMGGKVPFGPFWNNILSYWKQRDFANILYIRYEDMHKNLKSEILRTAKFLEKDVPKDVLPCLLDHLSIESMKNNPGTNYSQVKELLEKLEVGLGGEGIVRSGRAHGGKELMSEEQLKKMDLWSVECTKGTSFKI